MIEEGLNLWLGSDRISDISNLDSDGNLDCSILISLTSHKCMVVFKFKFEVNSFFASKFDLFEVHKWNCLVDLPT